MVSGAFLISYSIRACVARRLAFSSKALKSFRLRRMLRKAMPRIFGNVLITDPRDGGRRRQPGVLPNKPRRQDGSGASDAGKAMYQNPATPLELSFDERENDAEIRWRTEIGSLYEEILEPEFRWVRLNGLLEERADGTDTLRTKERRSCDESTGQIGMRCPGDSPGHQPLEARILKIRTSAQWLAFIYHIYCLS